MPYGIDVVPIPVEIWIPPSSQSLPGKLFLAAIILRNSNFEYLVTQWSSTGKVDQMGNTVIEVRLYGIPKVALTHRSFKSWIWVP